MCLLKVLVLWSGKNFFKNSRTITFQVVIELGLRECNHIFAFSFSEKGNNLNLTMSSPILLKCKVAHTSSNSLKCEYALSESRPWNLGSNCITPGFISKFPTLGGTTMQEGVVVRVGWRYSRKLLALWLTSTLLLLSFRPFRSLLLLSLPDPLDIGDGLKGLDGFGDSKFSILLLIGDSFLLNLCPEFLCQIGGGLSFLLGILKFIYFF